MSDSPDRPLLRLVRGTATREELAAVVAVLTARSATPVAAPPAPARRPLWAEPVLRAPVVPGPGAWRASGLPR